MEGGVEVPGGAEVTDASGKSVMPGLIESHTHLLGERSLEPGLKKYYDNLISSPLLPVLYGGEVLRKLLWVRRHVGPYPPRDDPVGPGD